MSEMMNISFLRTRQQFQLMMKIKGPRSDEYHIQIYSNEEDLKSKILSFAVHEAQQNNFY